MVGKKFLKLESEFKAGNLELKLKEAKFEGEKIVIWKLEVREISKLNQPVIREAGHRIKVQTRRFRQPVQTA